MDEQTSEFSELPARALRSFPTAARGDDPHPTGNDANERGAAVEATPRCVSCTVLLAATQNDL